MRTTLTIDKDVAAEIEKLRRKNGYSLQDLINRALRSGLKEITKKSTPQKNFTTNTVDLGESFLPSLDKISEVLAVCEGENYK